RTRERAEQRAREVQAGVDEAARMLAQGRAASATRLLGNLTQQFPAEPSLESLLERARNLEREQALREEIGKNIAVVREFASRREWDQALEFLGKVSRQGPECREYIEQAQNIQRLRDCD